MALCSHSSPAFVCICYIVMNINENARFPIVLMTLSHPNLSRALTLTAVSIIESFFPQEFSQLGEFHCAKRCFSVRWGHSQDYHIKHWMWNAVFPESKTLLRFGLGFDVQGLWLTQTQSQLIVSFHAVSGKESGQKIQVFGERPRCSLTSQTRS